jgi:metallo-beta-lactamase family protein
MQFVRRWRWTAYTRGAIAKLTFYGAARQVTGSMHLLEANGKLIAVHWGLFQGRRAENRELDRQHPCDPKSIHAAVVSHAHNDHIGRLPLACPQFMYRPL